MKNPPRLKVVFLTIPRIFAPWCRDVVDALGDRHDLVIYDADRPMVEQFAGVDIVIDHGGHVADRPMMDAAAAAGARFWQIMSIGYEHVDIAYLKSKFSQVANVPGTTSAASLAQTALMLTLMLSGRASQCADNFHGGVWLEPEGVELESKTLGIVGVGNSGKKMAALGAALGMRVIGANRSAFEPGAARELGLESVRPLDDLDGLIRESDVVSLHVALTDQTRRIIDKRRIGLMKPTALLINVARGGLLEEAALYEALLSNRIGGAGLDVFDPEPPQTDHPVFALPNVVVTPHIAGFTDGSSRKRAHFIAQNVDRVAVGQDALSVIGDAS